MSTQSTANPEVGRTIDAAGIATNYHQLGAGEPVVLIHGSGPGVSAWANWRLNLPSLAEHFQVFAPDMVGFGYTDRPAGTTYDMDTWVGQLVGFLDALGLPQVSIVGNSFGGGLALATAARHPDRVRRLVLMGSAGVGFDITPGLEAVWGYEPSVQAMRDLLDIFAYNRALVTDELAEMRYQASIQPGIQEAYSSMFPAPRQRWIQTMATPEDQVATLPHETLIIHGRDDKVVPLASSFHLFELIPRARLHVFGRCGHWTQIEHTAEFNGLVRSFLHGTP